MNIKLSTSKHQNTDPSLVVKCINEFSFSFYSITCTKTPDRNISISPLPVYALLNLIRSCSNQTVRQSLTNVLGQAECSIAKLIDFPKLEIELVTKERFLRADYIETLRNLEPQLLRIYENTAKLDEKLDEIGTFTRALALVLEARFDLDVQWKTPFKDLKQKGIFIGPSKQKFEITLMKILNHKFMYSKKPFGLELKICEFPLSVENLAFTVILPETNCLWDIESQLDAELFERLVNEMRPVKINSTLPEFCIDSHVNLAHTLRTFGLGELCDFAKRLDGLFIAGGGDSDASSLSHNTFRVSETCATASSCNRLVMRRDNDDNNANNKQIDNKKNRNETDLADESFTCDNPFLFFIRDTKSKLVLFMGKLMVPIYK